MIIISTTAEMNYILHLSRYLNTVAPVEVTRAYNGNSKSESIILLVADAVLKHLI
jgi:hypothetical protein